MNIVTLDLPDGQWFRYHSEPSHGQVKAITKKLINLTQDGYSEDILDIQTFLVVTIGDSWLVKDSEGREIPWSLEGIESAKQSIVTSCADACQTAIDKASPELGKDLSGVPKPGVKGKPSPN